LFAVNPLAWNSIEEDSGFPCVEEGLYPVTEFRRETSVF
jgi:hypothetical protein